MENNNNNEENRNDPVTFSKVPEGWSITGYLKTFINLPNSPFDNETKCHPIIVDNDGSETLIYASGSLKYLAEDLKKDSKDLTGARVKITKIPAREGYKGKVRSFYDLKVDESTPRKTFESKATVVSTDEF